MNKEKDELTQQTVDMAITQFFRGLREVKARANELSQKGMSRAIAFALNDGLTQVKIHLTSQREKDMAALLKNMFNYRTVMQAGLLKFNKKEQNDEQLELNINEENKE